MNYWVPVAAVVLLVLAVLGRWPYGFYSLLRLMVCLAAVYTATKAVSVEMRGWAWVMGGTALLFNPIFPIYIRRANWRILDLAAAIVFASCAAAFHSKAKAPYRG
jgi:FtsH-binding integral membrane protein